MLMICYYRNYTLTANFAISTDNFSRFGREKFTALIMCTSKVVNKENTRRLAKQTEAERCSSNQ